MTYAMAFATVGALLLATPALAAPSHGHTPATSTVAFNSRGGHADGDQDRHEMRDLLDKEVGAIFHNPHCDPDDRNGPDGDHDDKAANNPGRGRHVGRCIGKPATP